VTFFRSRHYKQESKGWKNPSPLLNKHKKIATSKLFPTWIHVNLKQLSGILTKRKQQWRKQSLESTALNIGSNRPAAQQETMTYLLWYHQQRHILNLTRRQVVSFCKIFWTLSTTICVQSNRPAKLIAITQNVVLVTMWTEIWRKCTQYYCF